MQDMPTTPSSLHIQLGRKSEAAAGQRTQTDFLETYTIQDYAS